MFRWFVFLLGIAAIAAPLGYMVGGSATPVVGIALPAIFGLVATAIGLLQPTLPAKEQAELIAASSTSPEIKNYIDTVTAKQATAPLRIGLSLVIFGIIYTTGAVIGTRARTEQWFALQVTTPPAFPWASGKTKPLTATSAFEWLSLQRELLAAGYSQERIVELYDIQVQEWDREEKKNPTAAKPVASTEIDLNAVLKGVKRSTPPFLMPTKPPSNPFERPGSPSSNPFTFPVSPGRSINSR